ncbi:MAG: hypothetical protein ACRDH2_19070, partial [Anaerolineales bacterium]
ERFEYVLQLDPNYPQAAEKLAEARQALLATATPTPEPTLTPAPLSDDPATILALAQQYAQAANWDGVIEQIARLRVISPAYEIVTADDLLFTAFRNRGLARIQGDAMEAGIRDLDQAAQFGPLDPEASSYRTYARYYLAAQSYWGLDWGQTVTILRELHLIAPNFRDTAPKLYQATLNYAAQLAAAGDYCAAAEFYAAAQTLAADQAIADAQATAAAICLLTPTPEPALDLTANPAPTDETPTPSP